METTGRQDLDMKVPVTEQEIAYANFTYEVINKRFYEQPDNIQRWRDDMAERAKRWPEITGEYFPVGADLD